MARRRHHATIRTFSLFSRRCSDQHCELPDLRPEAIFREGKSLASNLEALYAEEERLRIQSLAHIHSVRTGARLMLMVRFAAKLLTLRRRGEVDLGE